MSGHRPEHRKARLVDTSAFAPVVVARHLRTVLNDVPTRELGLAAEVAEADGEESAPLTVRGHARTTDGLAVLLARLGPRLDEDDGLFEIGHRVRVAPVPPLGARSTDFPVLQCSLQSSPCDSRQSLPRSRGARRVCRPSDSEESQGRSARHLFQGGRRISRGTGECSLRGPPLCRTLDRPGPGGGHSRGLAAGAVRRAPFSRSLVGD